MYPLPRLLCSQGGVEEKGGHGKVQREGELAPAKYYPDWLKALGRGSCLTVNIQLILTMPDIIFLFAGKLRNGAFRGDQDFLDP